MPQLFPKSKKLITVLLILIIFLSSTLVYIFAKEKLSYDPKYHINPAEKIQRAFKDGDINICSSKPTSAKDYPEFSEIYKRLDKENLEWNLYFSKQKKHG